MLDDPQYRFMVKIIMSYMDDRSLFCLLKTSKYFRSFLQHEVLWKTRTLKVFGRGYMGEGIDCNFYRRLAKTAILYEIPLSVYGQDTYGLDEAGFKKLSETALDYLAGEYIIHYGDLVHFEADGNYNDHGKFIYDGQRLIELDGGEDSYGQLPDIFHVLTPNKNRIFPVDYWNKILPSNECIWLRPEELGRISFDVQIYNEKSYIQGTFELDQLYTLIDISPLVDDFSVDVAWLVKVKNHILKSTKLLVDWQCRNEDIEEYINFSQVQGIPLYFCVKSDPTDLDADRLWCSFLQ